MRALFKTFEEKSRLVRLLNACLSGDGIRVLIGHENPDPDLRDLSLVAARCAVEGDEGFGLGVLGSTRMEYAHVVALVDHVARAVSDVLPETARVSRAKGNGNGSDDELEDDVSATGPATPAAPRRAASSRRRPAPARRSRRCAASATS